ncbi:unnamed protein product [Diamesa serratosioi]
MSRRAKIKVTANLTSRRSESKSKIEISSAKNVFAQCDEILTVKAEKNDIEKQNNNESPIQEDKAKDVTTTIDEKSIKGADVKSSESSSKKKIENIIAKQQPETNFVDDWLVPPLSPSKQRFETIKEFHDPLLSPIIINSNLQPPPVPTSPFPHHPQHSRVRTESLCSMKSTMSAYNKDISGVMRKNFRTEENNRIIDTKRESKERLNNKNLDKNQLRMFDMIYYNPTTNPMKTKITPAKEKEVKKPLKLDVKLESPVVKIKEPETISNFLVPQLKLGPNGEMILDETSLVVENEQQKQNRILLANANVVYDDELSGTYGYYTRQKRTREWPADETVKFYRCLHTIGTDFSLMLNLFPNRTRRDLKLKFKKEEKSNGALINKALLHPNMFDIDELQRELDNDEKAKKKALETKSKAETKDKMKKKTKVERILSDGDLVLNLADNNLQQEAAKENVNIPMPEKKPRKCRKKAEPKGTEMSVVQEIIAENINQEILIKQKYELHKIQIDDEEKPQEVVNDEKLVHEKILIEHEDDHKEILNVEKNDKQDIMLNQKILVDHEDDHKEIVNENVEHQEMVQELPKDQNLVTNNNDVIINVWKDVNNQILNIKDSNHYKDEVLTQPLINVADDHDILVEQYIENKEIVPTKLIYELPVQHSNAQRSDEEYYHSTNDPEVQQKITVDNVPCGTSAVQDDYEDLMKSLDFNSLVLAESQVDGKTVNEIYTMDSITEEISEKPLNLPQHVVDKIVSILNNADSDDEDA